MERIRIARDNGKRGGRPVSGSKEPSGLSTETQRVPVGNPAGYPAAKLSNLQSPISNLEAPEKIPPAAEKALLFEKNPPKAENGAKGDFRRLWCSAYREVFQTDYTWTGRDDAATRDILATGAVPSDVVTVATGAWRLPLKEKWHRDHALTVRLVCSHLNELRAIVTPAPIKLNKPANYW